jgi:hypothetical protein
VLRRSDLPAPEAIAALEHRALVLAWAGDPGHPESTAERLHELLPACELQVARELTDLFTWSATIAEFLGLMAIEWPDRDSREWLLGPRGGISACGRRPPSTCPGWTPASPRCSASRSPRRRSGSATTSSISSRSGTVLKSLVMAYDAGDRAEETWTPVLDGQGHLAVLAGG